ncbi:DUF2235 domain-containing protein [Dyadobacter chenwenxiniae]|uniref:DUF2235 domain-containing protein n=1 Tax=Dyadobacter chenwenxiniae TaxID=2906456 RepID=A0A9X1PRI0_9BACT|nr:DUF2235 domain-containing protein [Dyadobacter chenwenxiniae]MCF0064784.1 DUF2235 domain-containing protein [Dyadobacter chenwenxiniae]UON84160.1 DUF2235 domain-containing protein [Dyadobacter chenwenxiniae]
MKNIVICCDGTANEWTTPDKTSNVVQLFCMLAKDPTNTQQVRYYDPGVGTRGYTHVLDWWDQATGWSVDENVKQAYTFLMNFYEPGDRIFLFGFSRGAFTVRVLSGLIAKSGLLYKRNENLIEYAFKIFRGKNNENQARDFVTNLSQSVEIAFLGVWDTVSAMLQKASFSKLPTFFQDTELSEQVQYACQALSIDDLRHVAFRPILWGPVEPLSRMEQVWFAGAHSDVGGGYGPDSNDHRPARIPLQWMVKRAKKHGLLIDPSVAVDKIALPQDELGKLHRPDQSLPWVLAPFLNGRRSIPEKAIIRGTTTSMLSRIHQSVVDRIASRNDYQPRNLPACYEIVDDDGNVLSVIP